MGEASRFEVGRHGALLVARVYGLRTNGDAHAYRDAFRPHFAAAASPIALLADHRPVIIYPQDVADRLGELFADMNSKLQRVSILIARSNATLALQLERIVREAAYRNRRVCYTADDALSHLSGVLSTSESTQARSFLSSWQPS